MNIAVSFFDIYTSPVGGSPLYTDRPLRVGDTVYVETNESRVECVIQKIDTEGHRAYVSKDNASR